MRKLAWLIITPKHNPSLVTRGRGINDACPAPARGGTFLIFWSDYWTDPPVGPR